MGYVYRYLSDDDRPLVRCPYCNGDLTEEYGVDLTLSVGGHVFNVPTQLDEEGYLVDTDDNAVLHGHHSCTECGHCGEQLVYHEDCITEAD